MVSSDPDKSLNRLLAVWVQVGPHLPEAARDTLLTAIYAEVDLEYPTVKPKLEVAE